MHWALLNKRFGEHQPEFKHVQQSTCAAGVKHSGLVDVYTILYLKHAKKMKKGNGRKTSNWNAAMTTEVQFSTTISSQGRNTYQTKGGQESSWTSHSKPT